MTEVRGDATGRPVRRDLGLLVIRIGIGLNIALFLGYAKIAGGPGLWERLGENMERLGIPFAPALWGFMAAFSEFGGSILLILGLFFRPAAALLAITMLVAATRHLSLPEGEPGAGWKGASHALELLSVYLGLLLAGPGRFALGSLLSRRNRRRRS